MKQIKLQTRTTNKESIAIKRYLADISRIKQMSVQEEESCCIRIQNGDKDALNELVESNLRFVVTVAKQYESEDNKLEDLINEGNIGLVLAAQRYRLDSGFKFITYAVWYIRKYIMEFMTTSGRLVRLPTNKVAGINKLNSVINEMELKNGVEPQIDEIVDYLSDEQLDKANIYELHRLSKISYMRMDAPVNSNSEANLSLYDLFENMDERPDDYINMIDKTDQNIELLSCLQTKERKIISLSYGLNGSQVMKIDEIAEHLDVSRSNVVKLKTQALNKLKNRLLCY